MDIRSFFRTKVSTSTAEVAPLVHITPSPIVFSNLYPSYKAVRGAFEASKRQPYLLQFDGAAEPNPGPSCGAAVLFQRIDRDAWKPIWEGGNYYSRATNNQAEYQGLLLGLRAAASLNLQDLLIEGDSNLIVNQVTGEWQCRDEKLVPLRKQARELLEKFSYVGIKHVYREKNTYADALSKEGILKGEHFSRQLV